MYFEMICYTHCARFVSDDLLKKKLSDFLRRIAITLYDDL